MRTRRRFWIALLVLALLSPLGLLLPAWLGAGTAWGEWSQGELRQLLGFVPKGLQRLGDLWRAPLPGYGLPQESGGLARSSLGYVVSAIIGLVVVVALTYGLGRLLARRGRDDT